MYSLSVFTSWPNLRSLLCYIETVSVCIALELVLLCISDTYCKSMTTGYRPLANMDQYSTMGVLIK